MSKGPWLPYDDDKIASKSKPGDYVWRGKYRLSIRQWRYCLAFCGEALFDGVKSVCIAHDFQWEDPTAPRYKKKIILQNMANFYNRLQKVREAINDLLSSQQMGPEEVLGRLARMGRFDMDSFFDKPKEPGGPPIFNYEKARQSGATSLMKSIIFDRDGNVKKIEFQDAFGPLVKLGQHHRLFNRTQEQDKPVDPAKEAMLLYEEMLEQYGEEFTPREIAERVARKFPTVNVEDLVQEVSDANN